MAIMRRSWRNRGCSAIGGGVGSNNMILTVNGKYKMTISSTKTKSMAMWRNHIQRVKTVINDNIIEQVTDFKYLGYRISEYGSDLDDKL